jgi:hypothetical protein
MRVLKNSNNLPAADKSAGILFTTVRACRLSCVTFLLALLSLVWLPGVSRGIPNTVTYDGNDTHCGNACCQKFTITVNHVTDSIDIFIGAWESSPPDCFDHTCWAGQSNGGETFTSGADGFWDFRINVAHSDLFFTGPFPQTKDVWICAPYVCFQYFQSWYWASMPNNDGTAIENPLYEGSCQPFPSCASGCSYITVEPTGVGTFTENCGTKICFHNQSGSAQTSFSLNFEPPIDLLNPPCPLSTGGPVICNGGSNPNTVSSDPSCWSVNSQNLTTGDVTFTGCTVSNCATVCITIPRCENGPYTETIRLVSPANAAGCDSTNSVVNVAMKVAPQAGVNTDAATFNNAGGQNYPNPLETSTGFKTMIPFETSTSGVAKIMIVDQTGKNVFTETLNATYAGKHFFYFTGDKLPAGTYYYTIEFPRGVVIASKTMLIVK